MKLYLKSCLKSHEIFESITLMIPEELEQIQNRKKMTQHLKEFVLSLFKERDAPSINVYSIPKKHLIHVVFEKELQQEKNHLAKIKEIRNWVGDQQIFLRENFTNINRIPPEYIEKSILIIFRNYMRTCG
ncbi:hypothetical protein ES705_48312 [subsurface metagenome]